MPDLPLGWSLQRLGDAGGLSARRVDSFAGARPYLATSDVNQGDPAPSAEFTYSGRPARADLLLRPNDVLQAKMKATDKAFLVGKQHSGWLASTGFAQFNPQSVGNSSRFFLHLLASRLFLEAKDVRCVGSTQQAISDKELAEIRFAIPPRMEQEEIADVLDTLQCVIQETGSSIAKLEAVKQGLLHDLLTRGIDANGELRPPQAEAPHLYKESPLGWIPKDWGMQLLGEMAEVSRGKFTHRPRNDPRFYGGRHPFIQTGDIAAAAGEYISTFSQTLSDHGTSVSQEFPAGTIAITIAANIGDTAILAIPMFFPDSVVGVILNDSYSIRFVELSIRRTKRWLDARAPQSAQKNINLQDLRPLLLGVPCRDEQVEIAARYEALQSKVHLEGQFLNKCRQERAGLMDDLLTGRVRVTPLLAT